MKYLKIMGLFAAAMSLLLFAACGGGSGNNNNNKKNDPPPVSVSISIMPPTTLTMLVGESKTLNVTVTPQDTNFTVSVVPASGSGCEKSGNNAVTCTPTAADKYTVTVTADATKTATAQINVMEEEVEIDEGAGDITEITSEYGDIRIPISFTAVDDWTASITDYVSTSSAIRLSSVQDDCDVEPKSGGAGEHTINVTCAPNATGADRLADIVISTRDSEWSVTITQKPTPQGVVFTPGVFTTIQTALLTGINDSGQMAGGFANFSGGKGYLYNADASIEITHPATSDNPYANNVVSKINDNGQAAGAYQLSYMDPYQGFVYDDGVFHDFEDFPPAWNIAMGDFGINNSGHVVGTYTDGVTTSGFLKIGDLYTTIDYPGAAATYCTGINNNGLIVGFFADAAGKFSGFLYDAGNSGSEFTVISHPDGIDSGWVNGTTVYGINDSGMMAGYYLSKNGGSYGFLHDGNDFVKIIAHPDARVTGIGNTSTLVFDVNNSGQIVGSFFDDSGEHGFLLEQSNYSPPALSIAITITPTTLTMFVGETKTLNVITQNTDFTVSADPGSGCIKNGNNTVSCTPTAAGTYTVAVTATADATKKATVQVNVLEEEIEIIEIIEYSGVIKEIVHADRTESISVSFKSPDNWAAVSGNGDCSVTPASGAAGDDITVSVKCKPNDTGANRVINITISAGNAQLVVPVTQKATPKAIFTAFDFPAAEISGGPLAFNDSGQFLGYYIDYNAPNYPAYSFMYDTKTDNYIVIDPPGSTNSDTWGNNNSGQVIGYYFDSAGSQYAFLYDSKTGNYTVMNPPGSVGAWAEKINDSGQVVGNFGDSIGGYHGYLYDSKTGNYTVIDPPGSTDFVAGGITNSGQVFGSFGDSGDKEYGFLYDSNTGNYTVFDPPPGAAGFSVGYVNDSGQMTGDFWDSDDGEYGFLYDINTGNYTVIDPPGSTYSYVNDINNFGQVIGDFQDSEDREYGFLYDSKTGNYAVMAPPGSVGSSTWRIFDSGLVLGNFYDSDDRYYAYLYDIKTGNYAVMAPPGSTGSDIMNIRDDGQMVGYFIDSDDRRYGFLYDGDRFIEIAYPDETSTMPMRINNLGQILGGSWTDGGDSQWFVLEFEGL